MIEKNYYVKCILCGSYMVKFSIYSHELSQKHKKNNPELNKNYYQHIDFETYTKHKKVTDDNKCIKYVCKPCNFESKQYDEIVNHQDQKHFQRLREGYTI